MFGYGSVVGRDEWNVKSVVHVESGGTYYHRPFTNTDISCSCIPRSALLSRLVVLYSRVVVTTFVLWSYRFRLLAIKEANLAKLLRDSFQS